MAGYSGDYGVAKGDIISLYCYFLNNNIDNFKDF